MHHSLQVQEQQVQLLHKCAHVITGLLGKQLMNFWMILLGVNAVQLWIANSYYVYHRHCCYILEFFITIVWYRTVVLLYSQCYIQSVHDMHMQFL